MKVDIHLGQSFAITQGASHAPVPYRRRHPMNHGRSVPGKDSHSFAAWTRTFVVYVDEQYLRPEIPSWPQPIQDLSDLIESTPELRMLASAMFDEVPCKQPYLRDPAGHRQVRDYQHMLHLFSIIMTKIAPSWSMSEHGLGIVGFPFNAVLDWPMATRSGYAFFLKAEVNAKLKVILDTWRDNVLKTNKSQYVLTTDPDGWLSSKVLVTIEGETNVDGQDPLPFHKIFECDPIGDPIHWGFQCWDDFFVRKFRDMDKIRPVAFPDDPRWIVNACESRPYALQANVKEYDTFWLKGQPYSVVEMLNHHPDAGHFIGGTVFQAFLSATAYHRWSSPVAGKVIHSQVINGTYFSEPTFDGFANPEGPDQAGPDRAQGYISHVATRAMFFIDTEGPVGVICVLFVGMADVSTCEILEKFRHFPQKVSKGEELGMFHHGGSTYCLLFPPDVNLAWVTAASPGISEKNIPIRSGLAYACPAASTRRARPARKTLEELLGHDRMDMLV
ncbi:hypothetical protein CDV31_003046 [Fusarium ambrosium]|uniref:L-tryptophan decarboxylase PsiD-like domain-containing protein n=1 Tax=Fusarium ambrosium TaxID=131363 RepID=A0A428UV13_9HYPO|nr:hypothetical protein CDV31_003046 [Fusarium ambrosium]